jgi:hypothetical protein
MSDQQIEVPDKCPEATNMTKGDRLTIVFNQTAFFWNTDPDAFDPPLTVDIYKKGHRWVGKALKAEDVQYGWLTFLLEDERDCREPRKPEKKHTFHVGS